MFKVNVEQDLSGIPIRIKGMTKAGQYALANQAHADMNNYVPALNYNLRNQSYVSGDNKEIIYNTPYARKQFYVQHFNYTTPGTGSRWDLKAQAIHLGSWVKITKQAMR